MARTFGDVVAGLSLYAPGADPLFLRHLGQRVWEDICESYPWAFRSRKVGTITTLAARDLTVGVTHDDATVTSAAAFVASDLNRQFRVGTFPVYTIVTFTDASNVELDRPYTGTTNAAATDGQILDAYATMPADFGRFRVVADPSNRRQIVYWLSEAVLAVLDATRTNSGGLVQGLFPLQARASDGRVQYEMWPYPTTAVEYPFLYDADADTLSEATTLPGVMSDGGCLEEGMLARLAKWPGTATYKNPYFNLVLAQQLRQDYERSKHTLMLRDDDQYLQSLKDIPWEQFSHLPISDTLLRMTDAVARPPLFV